MRISNIKPKYIATGTLIFFLAFICAYIASAEFMAIGNSDASTTIHASISSGDYYLNLTSLDEVNIDLNATTSGNTSTADDTITVNTNTSGYKLYLSTDSTDTNSNKMYLNGNPSSGYSVNPVDSTSGAVSLSTNSWGYKLSGESDNQYKAVPIKGNETLFATKTGLTAGNDSTNNHTITYGVKADLGLPAGNYSATVSYSAVAEASSVSSLASVYPNEIERASSGTTTLTVTLPMMTNMEIGTWSVTITPSSGGTATTCTNPIATKNNDGSGIKITCTVPRTLAVGTYTVTATSSKYGSTYTASNALTYKPGPDLFTVTNMQDMNSDICDNTKTPSASATSYDTNGSHRDSDAYIPQWTLTDTRTGNKKYVVQKMPDGKCWMVQNLAIDPGTLPASKTNVSSDYVLPNTTSFSSPTAADVKTGSHTDGSLTSNGNWYSFQAATAGNGSSKAGDGDIVTAGDICPSNWRLPNGGSSGEFQTLYNYYNNESKFDAVWHPVYAGRHSVGSFYDSGSYGYWWSRTSKSSSLAYILKENTSGHINRTEDFGRSLGFSVRCVAKQSGE